MRESVTVVDSKDMSVRERALSFVLCFCLEIFTLIFNSLHNLHSFVQYIILDEGHRIKNRNCRLVRELKSFRSVSRLLLTGTPIQVFCSLFLLSLRGRHFVLELSSFFILI